MFLIYKKLRDREGIKIPNILQIQEAVFVKKNCYRRE